MGRLEKGHSVKSISEEFGIGVTSVKDWHRNKKFIEDYCTKNLVLDNGRTHLKNTHKIK